MNKSLMLQTYKYVFISITIDCKTFVDDVYRKACVSRDTFRMLRAYMEII